MARHGTGGEPRPLTVAIVGGGASGVLTATHLLRHPAARPRRIVLVERRAAVGAGTAFGTGRPCHLLNVPAARMSAFADEPEHFVSWLSRRDPNTGPGSFVARAHYGEYLRDVLAEAARRAGARHRLHTVTGEVEHVLPTGGRGVVGLQDGSTIEADAVVLALGNLPPRDPPLADRAFLAHARYVGDPWRPDALDRVQRDDDVLLIGSGLTAVDVVLSLGSLGHRGRIVAFSRHGLLPRTHRPGWACPAPVPELDAVLEARTARDLVCSFRAAVAAEHERGGDWRDVVDGMRVHTATLWGVLTDDERRRFARHLGRYWEVHRHRMAPEIGLTIDALIARGRLTVRPGRLLALDAADTGMHATMHRLGGTERLAIGHVVNCMGPRHDVVDAGDPVIDALVHAGAVRAGPLGLGLDVDGEGAVIGADGAPSPVLSALGGLRRGCLWESTAVPEIREQAAALARTIMAGPGAAPLPSLHGARPSQPPALVPSDRG